MQEDCKFFQRRSSRAGDTVSFCALDLAPEAPWRCPEHCRRYERVVGGRLGGDVRGRPEGRDAQAVEPAPDDPALAAGAAGVLGSAEEIIGRLAPELAAEERRRRRAQQEAEDSWWNRLRRSPRWRR
jgi:hypothetical protein